MGALDQRVRRGACATETHLGKLGHVLERMQEARSHLMRKRSPLSLLLGDLGVSGGGLAAWFVNSLLVLETKDKPRVLACYWLGVLT